MFPLQQSNLSVGINFPFWPCPPRYVHLKSIPEITIRTGPEKV